MSNTQIRLEEFARSKCLPYLLALPRFQPYCAELSFILVGSVGTGLCSETSDIDIAVISDERLHAIISKDTPWANHRPTEVNLDKRQLHYYAASFQELERKFRELDDASLYVYGNYRSLQDPHEQYARRIAECGLSDANVRKQRIEGKLDMLLRRQSALVESLGSQDIVVIGQICFEVIVRCLKAVALLDDTRFDPRKRLFSTALSGNMGQQIEPQVRQLVTAIGELGKIRDDGELLDFSFPGVLEEVVNVLVTEAKRQGFRTVLSRPDERQLEP